MTDRTAPAARAAALLAASFLAACILAATPAAAQGPGQLPLQSPSERMIERSNRDLQLQRRLGAMERQQDFEEGQLRQRIDRLETFPRLEPPPLPPPASGTPR